MRLGALEAGGTKMVCAIGLEDGTILESVSIPTETPALTIPKLIAYFKEKEIDALGIGAFGPIDLNEQAETYGHILDTPKLAWHGFDLLGTLKNELGVPVGLDTDVNGSCLGEVTFGCAKGLENVLYITIGTGVGTGIFVNGKLLHGMLHPEGGHILINRHANDEKGGICPYHKNCLEGFASGPAIEARWGEKAVNLVERNEVWELESDYIAEALVNYICILSPQKIILGGGVMHQEQLFPLIRKKVLEKLNGYLSTKELKNMDQYIVAASLNDNQGIMGCLQLAKNSFDVVQ